MRSVAVGINPSVVEMCLFSTCLRYGGWTGVSSAAEGTSARVSSLNPTRHEVLYRNHAGRLKEGITVASAR